jgi:hypothetical protein
VAMGAVTSKAGRSCRLATLTKPRHLFDKSLSNSSRCSIGVLIDTTLFLFIDSRPLDMWDSLSFDDSIACQKIYNLLKSNVDRSIKEIRDLELEP